MLFILQLTKMQEKQIHLCYITNLDFDLSLDLVNRNHIPVRTLVLKGFRDMNNWLSALG